MSHKGAQMTSQLDMPRVDGPDRLLTIPEVAKLMGLAVGSVYRLVSQRRIPVVRLSARCVRVRLSALLRMWEELTEQRMSVD